MGGNVLRTEIPKPEDRKCVYEITEWRFRPAYTGLWASLYCWTHYTETLGRIDVKELEGKLEEEIKAIVAGTIEQMIAANQLFEDTEMGSE